MDEIIKKIDERIDEIFKRSLQCGHDGMQYNECIARIHDLQWAKSLIILAQSKPLTIGDKIRESNESLSGFIRGQFGDDRVFHDGKEIDLDEFLNQPPTNTP
jgi:hypothetical protein